MFGSLLSGHLAPCALEGVACGVDCIIDVFFAGAMDLFGYDLAIVGVTYGAVCSGFGWHVLTDVSSNSICYHLCITLPDC